MSFSILNKLSPESWIARTTRRCSPVSVSSSRVEARPSTAFIGVRISWLIMARKADLARLVSSAMRWRSRASSFSRRRSRTCWRSRALCSAARRSRMSRTAVTWTCPAPRLIARDSISTGTGAPSAWFSRVSTATMPDRSGKSGAKSRTGRSFTWSSGRPARTQNAVLASRTMPSRCTSSPSNVLSVNCRKRSFSSRVRMALCRSTAAPARVRARMAANSDRNTMFSGCRARAPGVAEAVSHSVNGRMEHRDAMSSTGSATPTRAPGSRARQRAEACRNWCSPVAHSSVPASMESSTSGRL